jgi:alpha-tubulin suppressor-like RCC1 family protein
VSGGHSFSAISLADNSTCGLTTSGQALCWGYNGRFSLGDGSQTNSPVPVAVADGHIFSALGAGSLSGCGIESGGAAWCWGDNNLGELGIGVAGIVPTPVLADHP